MIGAKIPGDRAVSDLIGFALVFGIVLLSITLVYTFGIGALHEVQDAEATANSARAFDIVADNLRDIHTNGAPGRSTELDFAAGQMAVTGQVSMTVTDEDRNLTVVLVATPIRYTTSGVGFHYAGGAVIRSQGNAAVMIREPPFRFSEERVIISFVETRLAGQPASIGGGTARVAARRVGLPAVRAVEAGGVTFNISVTSPRYRAWSAYLERQGCQPIEDPANNTVTCEYQSDELYIRQTVVDVRLSI